MMGKYNRFMKNFKGENVTVLSQKSLIYMNLRLNLL